MRFIPIIVSIKKESERVKSAEFMKDHFQMFHRTMCHMCDDDLLLQRNDGERMCAG